MKNKFLQEIFTYFWIPVIISLVLYIFNQLKDVILGFVVLIALSSVYVLIRLYLVHKKWWLLVILMVVVLGAGGYFFIRSPSDSLTINGTRVAGLSVNFAGGAVSVNPAPTQTNGKYTRDTLVALTAAPGPGYDWGGWSGTGSDASNPTTVTMDDNKDITVIFEPRSSLIINNQLVIGSVASFAEGTVSLNPGPGPDGKYAKDTQVTLTARASSGYDWQNWTGTGSDTSNPAIVTMNTNKQISVVFEPRFTLVISNQLVIGSSITLNEGSVTVSPAPGQDDKYASGSVVTLTANPFTGYGWKTWSGTGADTSNPASVTITSDKHVAVAFEQRLLLMVNNHVLSGTALEVNGGSVSFNPAPGADGRFSRDAVTTLTASPATGYRFDRWSGDVTGDAASVSIPLTTNKNVNANFIRTFTLAVTDSPIEGGSVAPAGGAFDENASVVLTASPAAGFRFDHWSGDASGGVSPLTVTMNADKNITAHFTRGFSLTVTASPAAGGSISPGSGIFNADSTITLTALPAAGFRFDHWSGDVSGNTTSVSLTMNADKNVTAHFIQGFILTLNVNPAGGGTVSNVAGSYEAGAVVTITATPAAGFTFDRWSGDVTGALTNPTITITMNGNKTITARFKND